MKAEPGRAGTDPRVARSLRAADRDAVLSAASVGLTDPFMIPYALALGASAFEAGLLSSLRNALLAFVQLATAPLLRRLGSRRTLVLWTAGLQGLLFFPLALVQPLFGEWAVAALIAAYTLGTASAALGGPAWGSLVADYVTPEERGRYFGRRARLSGSAGTAAGLAAGIVLQATAHRGVLGFAILCAGGGLTRLLSWRALARFHDAGWHEDRERGHSFLGFVAAAPRSNVSRFALCLAANGFAAHLAAPFFAVYLLEEAGYSYATYTAVVLAGSVAGILASPRWGRLGDRHGNHAVMQLTIGAVTPLPALWLVSAHPAWMLAMNVLGAFVWAGLNLAAANFLYDAVRPAHRHRYLAHFNVLNGVAVSLGALAGGALVDGLGEVYDAPFFVLFYASAALRLLAALAFRRWVREVREVRAVGLREVVQDLFGQRLVGVLGFFSVRPEEERRRPPPS